MHKFLSILLFCIFALTKANASTVADYFGDTRADIAFPTISAVSRLDMIDYFNSGMENPILNALGGLSRITALNDTCLSLDYTSGIKLTLTLLPGKKPTLMLIETLSLPQQDSRITFYNEQWETLENSPLSIPTLSDWLSPQGIKHRTEVESTIPFMLSVANFNPTTLTLTFTSTIDSYFAGEKPVELSYLRPKIVYHWDGKKFKTIKKQ